MTAYRVVIEIESWMICFYPECIVKMRQKRNYALDYSEYILSFDDFWQNDMFRSFWAKINLAITTICYQKLHVMLLNLQELCKMNLPKLFGWDSFSPRILKTKRFIKNHQEIKYLCNNPSNFCRMFCKYPGNSTLNQFCITCKRY